ncbi:hypothetical protein GIB67_042368 [Kingdonia uniflora]|uniref:Uncharacterized protein n=1 Tax=Kingdonia uniflora TaxID=39325 RepID=A0A7J7MFB3_9MAGN|nr:hypothetical protein GIB67_042368 [Kingdonia uniflora]
MSTDGSSTIPFPDVLKASIAKLCLVYRGYLVVVPIGAIAYIPLAVPAVPASVLTVALFVNIPAWRWRSIWVSNGLVADSRGATIGTTAAFLLGRTLLKWTFDWEFMVRGLVLDKKTSLVLKVSYLASLDYRFHRANIRLYPTLFRVE